MFVSFLTMVEQSEWKMAGGFEKIHLGGKWSASVFEGTIKYREGPKQKVGCYQGRRPVLYEPPDKDGRGKFTAIDEERIDDIVCSSE